MENHLQQAEHNKKLLDLLLKDYPDTFNDWKVTICFYIAIHLIKALSEFHNVKLGDSHQEIFSAIGPKVKPKPFPLKDWVCSDYSTLYKYSRTSRYDGFISIEDHEETNSNNLKHCLTKLNYLRNYVYDQLRKPVSKK